MSDVTLRARGLVRFVCGALLLGLAGAASAQAQTAAADPEN
jgi:hypothetical protein